MPQVFDAPKGYRLAPGESDGAWSLLDPDDAVEAAAILGLDVPDAAKAQARHPGGTPRGGQFAREGGPGVGGAAVPNAGAAPPAKPSGDFGLSPEEGQRLRSEQAAARVLPSTADIDTPEREDLRNRVAADIYGTGARVKERRLDIVMGIPAGGKFSAVADPVAKARGSMVIDSDEVKTKLPEFQDGRGASAVHVESSDVILPRVLAKAFSSGDNVVLPVVGKTQAGLEKTLGEARAAGYKINLHYVDLPPPKAVQRAIGRWRETGRLVDPGYVASVGYQPRDNYERLKNDARVAGFAKYDNDVPLGAGPRVLEDHLAKLHRAVDDAADRGARRADQGKGHPAGDDRGPGGRGDTDPSGSPGEVRGPLRPGDDPP